MKISSYFGASFLIGMILLSSPVVLAGGASNEESKEDSNKKTNSLPLNKGQNLAVDKSKKSNADQQKNEAKKIYDLFNKSFVKSIASIQCLKDIDCINSEDDVLKYSVFNIRLLYKLEEAAQKNDIWAMYYIGLIAYERAEDYADRASYIRDRDFIFTAMVLNRYKDDQYIRAKKFLKEPAKARIPEACQMMGNIYSKGLGVKVDVNQAMDFYYCAALEFMSADRNLEAEIILKSMNETTIPTDARIVDVYAKLNKNNR
jgi:TPR repeat protein